MKKYKNLIFLLFIFIITVMLVGCGGNGEEQRALQIKGSDTEVNVVQHLSEIYMEDNEDVQIAVTGGGSGTGIAALINDEVDIANSSRDMKDSEVEDAENNGIEPVQFIIAMDGLTIIVNENNPVKELTVDEIGQIFRGDITNWQEVGGSDLDISLYGRQSNSGTFIYFRDNVLKSDYSQEMKRMNGNAQIVESIKTDKAGISYVGVGYAVDDNNNEVDGLNIVDVAIDENSPASSPLKAENVKDGSYPLARPLNQYTNGVPEGMVREFIEFELSDKGQEIVVEEGFYPVSPEFQEINNENINK
ncbi:MAG: PstS family phosphate ABC transporter substrate-binding protein [Bacillota bacterium]